MKRLAKLWSGGAIILILAAMTLGAGHGIPSKSRYVTDPGGTSPAVIYLASAQATSLQEDAEKAQDPYPLRPPDTSSPRQTLRSFLTNADFAIVITSYSIHYTKLYDEISKVQDKLDLVGRKTSETAVIEFIEPPINKFAV